MRAPKKLPTLLLLLLTVVGSGYAKPDARYLLIAHRGGVVEDKFPDNTAAALQAAVNRGYRGVEVDIRETKDGELVMRHDPDWKLDYHEARAVINLNWAETQRLHTALADQHPWRFEDVVKAAHDAGLILMLDSKDPHSPSFPARVEAILRRHDMLGRCYIIGTGDALAHFTGKAPVGKKFTSLHALIEADPTAKNRYFLFDHGTLTAEQVRWAQDHGVKVVPSINAYHYYDATTMEGKTRAEIAPIILAAAKADIEKLQALGVTEFQIDSEFDPWF